TSQGSLDGKSACLLLPPLILRRISASDTFHTVAHAFQYRNQPLSLVALNLDHAVFDRPAGATPNFELRGQCEQASLIKRDVGSSRHALAPSALRLPTEPDHRGALAGHFLLRHGRLDDEFGWWCYSFSASHDQASRQVHDLSLDQAQHFGSIVHLPEF